MARAVPPPSGNGEAALARDLRSPAADRRDRDRDARAVDHHELALGASVEVRDDGPFRNLGLKHDARSVERESLGEPDGSLFIERPAHAVVSSDAKGPAPRRHGIGQRL